MISSFPFQQQMPTANAQSRRATMVWWLWFAGVIGITGVIGFRLLKTTPSFASVAWLFLVAGVIAIFYQPRYGVYLIASFSLAGDGLLTPWYPFIKNLSSAESLLYVGRATSFSPAEILIALTFISWLGRALILRKLKWYAGPLFLPALLFTAAITFGLVYGLLNHANMTIALWEVRSIYYLPIMLLLTSNLIETPAHVNCLIWMIVIALFIDSLSGASFVIFVLNFDLHTLEAIAEHSYSVHLNTLYILTIGVWLFRGSRVKRIILPLMMPTVLLSYFANQRRASYITLAVALLFVAIILYRENRRIFWRIIPILSVVGLIYIAAFWNSSGGIGGPARAIRSVIAPQPGGRDDSSNVYRVLENLNSRFTIKQRPFTGVGFGNKFYIAVPMPDISFFIWWEYITHNSILWFWMQSGIGGFISLLVMVGMAVMVGVRALWRMPSGDLSAFALMATLYVVMHFIYAYVDMSWEAQSMIYVGVMMGLLNTMERIANLEQVAVRPALHAQYRWPWQAHPSSALEL